MNGEQGEVVPPSERIRRLERKALVVRSRLLDKVVALDVRRHRLARLGAKATYVSKRAVLGLALATAGVLALAFAVRRTRSERGWRELLRRARSLGGE